MCFEERYFTKIPGSSAIASATFMRVVVLQGIQRFVMIFARKGCDQIVILLGVRHVVARAATIADIVEDFAMCRGCSVKGVGISSTGSWMT